MNYETELAQLLVRMGTERGVDIETIVADLRWAQFPPFVDANALRSSLLDVVESWWRADLEDRINQLRTQLAGAASAPAARVDTTSQTPQEGVERQPMAETPPGVGSEQFAATPEPPRDATVEEPAVDAANAADAAEALPSDATMIWNTRGG
jgi:hypothetical protein